MWITHMFACSKSPTRNTSPSSWSTFTAIPWIFISPLHACNISWTSLWNGNFQINGSVDDWNFLISFTAFIHLFFLFSSFLSSPSLFFTSSTLAICLAFSSLIFFICALIRVFLVLWAIFINKNKSPMYISFPILDHYHLIDLYDNRKQNAKFNTYHFKQNIKVYP